MTAAGARGDAPRPAILNFVLSCQINKQQAKWIHAGRFLYACLNNLLNKQAENANKSGFVEGQQLFFSMQGHFRHSNGNVVKQPTVSIFDLQRHFAVRH